MRFASLEEPWEEVEADMIIDSTPHFLHYESAKRGLTAGRHMIFCKPMCITMHQALEMVELAEANNVKITVAQQLRYVGIVQKLAEIIQSGELGSVSSVYLEWHSTAWARQPGWRLEQPDFMLLEGSIHHLDYVRMILGSDAVNVMARTWKDPWNPKKSNDSCTAIFEMDNGIMLSYRTTWTGKSQPLSDWWCDWRVEAENGWLTVHNGDVKVNGESIDIGSREEYGLNLPKQNVEIFRETKAWIEGGPEPGFSGRNNLPSLAMIFGARQSADEKKMLLIDSEHWNGLE